MRENPQTARLVRGEDGEESQGTAFAWIPGREGGSTLKDESQDTGYLILSLTEAMEESRRLRQEISSGVKGGQGDGASPEEGGAEAAPPKRV